MAFELNIATVAGLTMEADVVDKGFIAQHIGIPMTEDFPGLYTGTVPLLPVMPYGRYGVVFYDISTSPRTVVGSGTLLWDGSAEIDLTRGEVPFITQEDT